jgi:hypothetical protein
MFERIRLMSVIAVVAVETAAAGSGSELVEVEVEVEEVAHLVPGNLPAATMETEVELSQPSSQKILPLRSFLQYFEQIVAEAVVI